MPARNRETRPYTAPQARTVGLRFPSWTRFKFVTSGLSDAKVWWEILLFVGHGAITRGAGRRHARPQVSGAGAVVPLRARFHLRPFPSAAPPDVGRSAPACVRHGLPGAAQLTL